MIGSEFAFGLVSTDGSRDEEEMIIEIGSNPNVIAAASYTDGTYDLVGEYTNTNELMSISTHLRALQSVEKVVMHTILQDKGGECELTNLHLRVLHCLVQDARMSIVDIANQTGLTARRVRRVLQDLEETNSVRATANLELGAASGIPFIVWFSFDERKIGPEEFRVWLWENYSHPLWQVYVSVSEPIVGALFAVDSLPDLDSLVRAVRSSEYVKTAKVSIGTHHHYFKTPRRRRLEEMVARAFGE